MATQPGFQREQPDQTDKESNKDGECSERSSDEDKNPYDYNLDIDVGAHMSREDLKSSLERLPKVPEKMREGMRLETLIMEKDVIVG